MKILRQARTGRAFTLVEVIISIALFSFVMLAIYASWSAIIKGSKAGLDAAATAQRVRIAFKAVEGALLTAQYFPANKLYYEFQYDVESEYFHSFSCVSKLPPENFPGTGSFDPGAPRRVTFFIKPTEGGTNDLVMSQIPMMAVTNDVIQPYEITLVRDCTMFYLQFWNKAKGIWVDKPPETNALPSMMRVSIGWGRYKDTPEPAEADTCVIALSGSNVPEQLSRPQVTQ